MAWATLAAVLLSPVIAVWVGRYLQNRSEDRNRKYWVLSTLVATRHSVFADDRIRALNTIELIYAKDEKVRRLYREFLDIVTTGSPDENLTADTVMRMNNKIQELIAAMARNLGMGEHFASTDYARGYVPRQFQITSERSIRLQDAATSFFEAVNKSHKP